MFVYSNVYSNSFFKVKLTNESIKKDYLVKRKGNLQGHATLFIRRNLFYKYVLKFQQQKNLIGLIATSNN